MKWLQTYESTSAHFLSSPPAFSTIFYKSANFVSSFSNLFFWSESFVSNLDWVDSKLVVFFSRVDSLLSRSEYLLAKLLIYSSCPWTLDLTVNNIFFRSLISPLALSTFAVKESNWFWFDFCDSVSCCLRVVTSSYVTFSVVCKSLIYFETSFTYWAVFFSCCWRVLILLAMS